jgi:predicted nucleic acid-binding protein
VFAVDQAIAVRAKDIVLAHHRLSARDAMHVTVMHQHGIEEILSFDSGFDGLSDVRRLS